MITLDELRFAQQRLEERECCVGSPRGPQGIIERVFKGRNTDTIRCKVLMESGAVRYCDVLDVYAR